MDNDTVKENMTERWRELEEKVTSITDMLRSARQFAASIADIPESTAQELERLLAEVSLWETNLSML